MADYEIGYGKPPRSRRFQPGVSGNPRGRPKKKSSPLVETINKVLSAAIQYRVRGRTKVASALELSLKMLVDRAVSGDLEAAEVLSQDSRARGALWRCGGRADCDQRLDAGLRGPIRGRKSAGSREES